jgi:hypothetical protein
VEKVAGILTQEPYGFAPDCPIREDERSGNVAYSRHQIVYGTLSKTIATAVNAFLHRKFADGMDSKFKWH